MGLIDVLAPILISITFSLPWLSTSRTSHFSKGSFQGREKRRSENMWEEKKTEMKRFMSDAMLIGPFCLQK